MTTQPTTSSPTDALLELGDRHNSPNYAPARLVLDRGEGSRVWDLDGREYLDFMAGIAVCALGHGHPDLVAALAEQAPRLMHVSNAFYTEPQIRLMERLAESSFADRVFLCNSGTEATEAAMKLAKRFHASGAGARSRMVSMKYSFHGRTLASITATGQPKYHKGFEPLVPGVEYAEFNDLASVEALVDADTVAVIVEPIQGEGGVRPATPEFLRGVRDACDAHGALLIFDEVQTGIGRTGALFGYENYGVEPDIICLAKGLGGGFPIGAMMATERGFTGWERGSHASTFGGNPLACAAALTVLDVIERDNLLQNARDRGEQLRAGLRALADEFDQILDVRGTGLMCGAECTPGVAGELVGHCRAEGLLLNTAGGHTLRMVPPLNVSADEVDTALTKLRNAFARL